MEHTRLKSDNNVQYKASCVKNSKEEEFHIFHIFTLICLKTEEKARKNLHSVCCTANNVVLISLCVCVTRGKKKWLLHLLQMLLLLLILIRPSSYFIYT